MTNPTNQQTASKVLLIVFVLFFTGIYSCNNAADEKKADAAPAVDTMKTMTDTTHSMAADSTKPAVTDTGRETKVPKP
jgi:hypothetical protein